MANHNLPTLTSTYANFVSEMDARMDDISIGFDPALTAVTNQATGTIRWVAASDKWEKWSGSAWGDLSSSYAINISGNAATATKLATARTIAGVSFDGSANISIGHSAVGAPSTTGTGATGTWGISITGNAATVTGGVYTTTDQSIGGVKSFTSQIRVSNGTATSPSIAFNSDGSVDTGLYWTSDGFTNFTNNGVYSGSIQAGGNLLMVGNITAYGSTTAPSDIRIKTNILKISNALDKVLSLNGITYDRTDIQYPRQTGIIAQEVQKVLPEAIIVLNDPRKTLTVAYGNLVGLLIEAIKELKAEVDTLKNKS